MIERTPCYNSIEANRHLDAQDRREAKYEALVAELESDMTRALSGLQAHVPGYVGNSLRNSEQPQSAADAVYSSFDYYETMNCLMVALRYSTCPLVGALRKEQIKRYALDMADSLIDVRGM